MFYSVICRISLDTGELICQSGTNEPLWPLENYSPPAACHIINPIINQLRERKGSGKCWTGKMNRSVQLRGAPLGRAKQVMWRADGQNEEGGRGGMRVEETGGEKSNLAFVKVNTWPFAQQEVIVLHMLACGRSVQRGGRTLTSRISSVCWRLSPVRVPVCEGFHNVRIYGGLSLRPSTDPY